MDYAFPVERFDNIRLDIDARPQSFGLFFPRQRPARHALPGEAIRLRFGRFGGPRLDALCLVRADVVFHRHGLVRVVDGQAVAPDDRRAGVALLSRLNGAEDGSPDPEPIRQGLARELGFDDWADLYRFELSREDGRGQGAGGRLIRAVVGWGLV